MSGFALGPFVLHALAGRGGTGEVWRGVHAGQGVPVAVKVLTADVAREPRYQAAFRREVRSVARLHHPGVVMVFEHGVVDPAAAEASEGRLTPGSPYLAMELASRGSLKDVRDPLPWPLLRDLLLALLDALAHAHARGVVHRDLKPGNVLLSGPDDARPGVKITDFGISQALDEPGASRQVRGTPRYMAPEQFRPGWREQGPWTDLYALGCVAWELATGAPPFAGQDTVALRNAHTYAEVPPLRPRVPVPEGFEHWLARLLEKSPRARFRRAADAAWALVRLDQATPIEATTSVVPFALQAHATLTLDATLIGGELDTEGWLEARDPAPAVPAGLDLRPEPPPHPPDWRRPDEAARSPQLIGAGLGLYGLRTVPLVGRVAERDRIWEALGEVRRTGQARLLVLQGAAGNGKSRLIEWMGERAHELGAATVLEAVHGPEGGPADGLSRMVARHLRCVGLGREDARVWIQRSTATLPGDGAEVTVEDEVAALLELVAPSTDGDAVQVRFGRPEERHAVVRRLVMRLAHRRPVVLWLDDVQWGTDTLNFVRFLLDREPPGPVLVLATAQEEALAERPIERAQVEALLEGPRASRLLLGPLEPAERRELVRQLLGLEDALAERVADRTGGNPLFAVQLLGDWVTRGVLVPRADGFALVPGAAIELPDDLHEVWRRRIDRVLAGLPPDARDALELAAALGQDVDAAEWAAACAEAGVLVPELLVERLVTWRLARPADLGWSFVHGMIRDSLRRIAIEGSRWARHNACCARMLTGREGVAADRLGRTLYESGDLEGACDALARGASARIDTFDTGLALTAIALREEALDRLDPPASDPRRAQGWLLRSKIHLHRGELDEALRDARRAEEAAVLHRWIRLLPTAVRRVAAVAAARGDLPLAEQQYERSMALYSALGADRAAAFELRELGRIAVLAGDLPTAEARTRRAIACFEELGDPKGLGLCLNALGDIARLRRDWDGAAALFRRALALHQSQGARGRVSTCLHGLAEIARFQGDLDEAERAYLRVIELDEAMGREPSIPRLNLGLCLLARGRYEAAERRFASVRTAWETQQKRGYLACLDVMVLPCLAHRRAWGEWDARLAEATSLLSETSMVDIDIAWTARLAGDLARQVGRPERALRAYAIARDQWRALGDTERLRGVETAMAAIEES